MVSKHIKRDWTGHREEVIRPTYERISVEIFSYDHQYTHAYIVPEINTGTNLHQTQQINMTCLESKDGVSAFTVEQDFNCRAEGEYRIDILYQTKDRKDYVGRFNMDLTNKSEVYYASDAVIAKADTTKINPKIKDKTAKPVTTHVIRGEDVKFDGEPNMLKRKTFFKDLGQKGNYKLVFELPYNCFFMGLIIRKVITFTGDNVDSPDTNLLLKKAEFHLSKETDPTEASIEIGYDDAFENDLSRSGFYMDYVDEVNIYVKETANEGNKAMIRRFGGYISNVKHDDDRTNITLSCADRLIDAEHIFILDMLLILQGTVDKKDWEYYNPINFRSYGEALKYLCDTFQTTLKSNIKKNYLVQGEKYSTGLAIKFGKKKDVKKFVTKNMHLNIHNNFITVRNKSNGVEEQSIVLYNAKNHSKSPIQLKNRHDETKQYLTFHLTYGLGDPKTETKQTISQTVDNSQYVAGAQKFGKCGQSQDGNYVMAVAQPSAGRGDYNYQTLYRTVFKNKCPHCGGKLVWDSGRSDTKCVYCGGYGGSKREWGDISETEITCTECCADYDAVTGWEKDGGFSTRLETVAEPVESSREEQDQLHNGEMVAIPESNSTASSENILETIANIAKQYSYALGTTSSYSEMKQAGRGDCWAFSDLIFTELKDRNVSCRICEYDSGYASNHRTVIYKDENGNWANFPYREYGLDRMLNDTSGINFDSFIKEHKGNNINNVSLKTKSSTKTETTEITTYKGYDRDKPIQCYFEITYSTHKSWKAQKQKIYLNFTQKKGDERDISGLPNGIWINNAQRQISVDLSKFFLDNDVGQDIFLHTIRMVAPKIETTVEENSTSTSDTETESIEVDKAKTEWYTHDRSTKDYASCKIDIYQIIFDNKQDLNPTDLQACGKKVGDVMESVVESAKYRVHMKYGLHRKDDVIEFRVDDAREPSFLAQEGDDNNILEWSNIEYNPVSNLRNCSICVFKSNDGKYKYVATSNLRSILNYGEHAVLQTNSEVIGSREAYFNARNAKDFVPTQEYSYTIVLPYAPNLKLGDLVQVISNSRKLNDIKTIESIKVTYDIKQMPRIQTEIGLDELEPYLRIKKEMQDMRNNTKKKNTNFSSTATPVQDEDIYIWDN